MELMVERLYSFVPDLPEILGDLAPNLQVWWGVARWRRLRLKRVEK